MWSQMTASALINGTGIVTYSLCNECASSIVIKDWKYVSKFCIKCDKRTFSMKYPGHTEKYLSSFYDLSKFKDGETVAVPENGRGWRDLAPCTVTGRGAVVTVVLAPGCCKPTVTTAGGELKFDFCESCQKRTSWAKYPKNFKSNN